MSTALTKLTENMANVFGMDSSNAKELTDTLKSTAFKVKDGVVTDAQMIALMIVSQQYGLNPWTREIYAFPDKQNGIVPVVGVDGWSRILNNNEMFDGMEFVYSDEIVTPKGGKPCPAWIECIIYRKDRNRPTRVREYLDETYREPFAGTNKNGGTYAVNGPWQTHTKRFLRHKALIQCARIAMGFVGIFDEDEADRIIQEKEINPRKNMAQAESIDSVIAEIKSMTHTDQFKTIDHTKYSAEEKNQIREAMKARKKELETPPVRNWTQEIKECGDQTTLLELLKEIPESVQIELQDIVDTHFDLLRTQ